MSRILLHFVLPFLLPLVGFLLWSWLARRRSAGGLATILQDTPWFWVVVSGFVLMAGSLSFLALSGGADPGSRIIAPRYEDGRVVPAQIE